MSGFLLDTSALLYWTVSPEDLSSRARTFLHRHKSEEAYVSAISVWEIGLKVRQNKLLLGFDFREYVQRLEQISNLTILPVDLGIWIANLELDWSHRDPADRTIVATAVLRDLPLLTSDKEIRRFYRRVVW